LHHRIWRAGLLKDELDHAHDRAVFLEHREAESKKQDAQPEQEQWRRIHIVAEQARRDRNRTSGYHGNLMLQLDELRNFSA
jgi:hypothetical protein